MKKWSNEKNETTPKNCSSSKKGQSCEWKFVYIISKLISPSTWRRRFAEGPSSRFFSRLVPFSAVLVSLILEEKRKLELKYDQMTGTRKVTKCSWKLNERCLPSSSFQGKKMASKRGIASISAIDLRRNPRSINLAVQPNPSMASLPKLNALCSWIVNLLSATSSSPTASGRHQNIYENSLSKLQTRTKICI